MAGFGLGNYINPGVGSFIDQRRNALAGLGAGFLNGQPGAGVQAGIQADDAYATQQRAEAERQAEIAKAAERTNATVEYFKSKGYDDLVAAAAGGAPMGGLWTEAINRGMPVPEPGPIKASAGDVFLDPRTYQPIASIPDPKATIAADKEGFDRESALWKEYMAAEPVETYQALKNSYERIRQSAATDSGPGDLGLIFNYMKMLDPGSVVREGEFATAENAGGIGQQVSNIYNRIVSGERLTPELRQQFLAAAERLYGEASSNLDAVNKQIGTRATGWGVDGSRIIIVPEIYAPIADLYKKYGLEAP